MESATGSSRRSELTATLHRLRSTLARIKAELELSEVDGTTPPIDRLLAGLDEAFALLGTVESAGEAAAHVLVVDDDERLAEITARGLRRLGYEADASSALRPLQEGEVLVLDLSLLTGLDAAVRRSVRAARPIVVTGATDAASQALASSVDASAYLIKPVDLDDLVAAINLRTAEA